MITMQGNIHLAVYVLAYLLKVTFWELELILFKGIAFFKKKKKNFIPLKHPCQSKYYASVLLESSSPYFVNKDYF